MSDYEKPRPRKGFTITACQWRDGRVVGCTYTPDSPSPVVAASRESPALSKPARGVLATEQGKLL